MQEDSVVVIALVPAISNPMGFHITSNWCVQRSCSAKLYALRTGRHGGQRANSAQPAISLRSHKQAEIGSSYMAYNRRSHTVKLRTALLYEMRWHIYS